MTQEQKVKAYDKAIEKIKYVMEHGVSPVLNKEDLQDIFPELKESEDERIRKELIENKENKVMHELIVGEHMDFWRLEYWKWFFPHPNYEPINNGRIHLFGNFYWRK